MTDVTTDRAAVPQQQQKPRAGEQAAPRFEDAVCELCGRPPTQPIMRTVDIAWRKPGVFNLVRCEHCDLVITTPRPVPEGMHLYYADWYNFKNPEQVRHEAKHSLPNRYIQWARLKVLERTGPLARGCRLLDVGAGFGVQLDYYIEKRGVKGTALDFDPATSDRSFVKDKAEVRTGDLLSAGFETGSFDVVTLYETLEHVYQPKATLDEALRILKPGGRLVVEVPNFGAALRRLFRRYWMSIMTPVHLHHFTRGSLRRVVDAAGFETRYHKCNFVPFESTGSWLMLYCGKTGRRMYEVTSPDGLRRSKYVHLPFLGFLAAWTLLVDFNIQGPLSVLNASGAQTLIAVKPR